MSSPASSYPPAGLRAHLAAVVLGLTFTVSAVSGLLLIFHSASPVHWLTPTPELMERVADCERLVGRETRDRCKQIAVASRLAQEASDVRLARR